MATLNYVLIGLLGAMLALALYSAKVDFSKGSAVKKPKIIRIA